MSDEPTDLRRTPASSRDDALAILQRLTAAGHIAYLAGGCVRDQLLGLDPADYDIATDARPQQIRALFNSTQAVGAAFGVMLVRRGRSTVEVATFRVDEPYVDGRHPAGVRFTTAQEDARRRDFTINGLFYDPLNGRVIDYVGGQRDLEQRILRAIGDADARFCEDYLRLLRAVRFASRFELTIDPATDAAIGRHAARLQAISPERIADELRRMLTAPTRAAAWWLLRQYRLADAAFRFTGESAPGASGAPSDAIFDNLAPMEQIPFGLALAGGVLAYLGAASDAQIVATLSAPAAKRIVHGLRRALRISNDEADMALGTLIGAGLMLSEPPPTVAQLKRFLARPTAAMSRALLWAIAKSGILTQRIAAVQGMLDELAQSDYAPDPLINGDDLTAVGLPPGPIYKRVLDAVYDAQLEGRVTARQDALDLALTLAKDQDRSR